MQVCDLGLMVAVDARGMRVPKPVVLRPPDQSTKDVQHALPVMRRLQYNKSTASVPQQGSVLEPATPVARGSSVRPRQGGSKESSTNGYVLPGDGGTVQNGTAGGAVVTSTSGMAAAAAANSTNGTAPNSTAANSTAALGPQVVSTRPAFHRVGSKSWTSVLPTGSGMQQHCTAGCGGEGVHGPRSETGHLQVRVSPCMHALGLPFSR